MDTDLRAEPMKDVLERLAAGRGVRASAVFDLAGQCLAWHEESLLAGLGSSIVEMLAEGADRADRANVDGGTDEIVVRFERSTLVVRRTRWLILAVLVDAQLEVEGSGPAVAIDTALQLMNLRLGSRRPFADSQTMRTVTAADESPALRTARLPRV